VDDLEEGETKMEIGLILVVMAIAGFVLLLQDSGNTRGIFSKSETVLVETPLEILNKRYARGEIDREEYEERRKTLTQ
jgi:putative membrane protein